ncbi:MULTISPECIES: pyridoxal phosphate-dependent decarboxylase family protein [unclassified Arthrobacter]|uniref:pyridoxal phosphate-dependent decarboxylase family protein n=1 Tax=unclassified Arthrobacter TaxID=235627 RepID=UPI001F02339A|nr:pyridoxal-dependent decarboxylase [Arthrobacter sp. FW305-BF8]UKA55855.1 aspartate aminotransferase family protein [Arthrobacter sp. FW305-BF8]
MSAGAEPYRDALAAAVRHATRWLESQPSRRVGPQQAARELAAAFDGALPQSGMPPAAVVDYLASHAEPGLMAMPSGRFFGWVIGGTLPAAMAADWLVSAWDQNSVLRYATPAIAAIEDAAGQWLLQLLGLPEESDVGFVTGATMANFTGLAAARWRLLKGAGWDLERDGLFGAPRIHCLVGEERHETVDLALRYLGMGSPTVVPADSQGRIDAAELDCALDRIALKHAAANSPGAAQSGGSQGSEPAPVLVCLQAGNLHSGAFDPFTAAVAVSKAHGAWVHVDGAFGLWAAAVPELAGLTAGVERADSWATDAHKSLNVPYDCGVVAVRDAQALRSAMGLHASYLLQDADGLGDPSQRVPELSRRARGVPVWAALKSLGRDGVAGQIRRLATSAAQLAEQLTAIDGVEVLNDVGYTQISVAFGDDATSRRVAERLIADGKVWMSGSRWHGRDVVRISVSNWTTDADDVTTAVEAVRAAFQAVRSGGH